MRACLLAPDKAPLKPWNIHPLLRVGLALTVKASPLLCQPPAGLIVPAPNGITGETEVVNRYCVVKAAV